MDNRVALVSLVVRYKVFSKCLFMAKRLGVHTLGSSHHLLALYSLHICCFFPPVVKGSRFCMSLAGLGYHVQEEYLDQLWDIIKFFVYCLHL